MARVDPRYMKLQRHLDRQTLGLPTTRSGTEIKLLEHIFTPEQAELACCLDYRLEPLETIYKRARDLVTSLEELQRRLLEIQKNGGIESRQQDGRLLFRNAPLFVGMWEYQLDRLTPELAADFDTYSGTKQAGLAFVGTKLPQLRTIPVDRSLRPQHNVSTFDEVGKLLERANEPFVILECICRKKQALLGRPCRKTRRLETCLVVGHMAEEYVRAGHGRQIPRQEAVKIIDKNQKQGLVLQPSNSEQAEFICSCCGCCCGVLDAHQKIPKPLEYWATNFFAAVSQESCDGCGNCAKRCQVGAVRVDSGAGKSVVDLDLCLGCGVCVPTCPTQSISLKKKATEVRPPPTRDDLIEIIQAGRKGRLGRLRLTGKLVVDALRTGRTQVLKM